MSTIDYKNLKEKLIVAYTKQILNEKPTINVNDLQSKANLPLIRSIHSHINCLAPYKIPSSLDIALNTIDLPKIYENVDKREKENKIPNLRYDDFIVLELLNYFKNDFFKWVNQPSCQCGNNDQIEHKGIKKPPANNPDQISIIEVYQCSKCKRIIEFPRINNPISLLRTRNGRCGEWVNCFLLILEALIGEGKDRIRYVLNHEDHVWCEYYSYGLQKWVHLDPCEAVFDEPLLYCNNWGKKMSYVIGFNMNSIVDLSDKYITKEKQINQTEVVDPKEVEKVIEFYNFKKLHDVYDILKNEQNEINSLLEIYKNIIVPRNKEQVKGDIKSTPSSNIPKGRQTGSAEWTKNRGENG
ncbi:PNG1 [Candida pseudojiufengensis]|uniref:PNG1 n=1 Tax=Candida pseudojiufengensis TaxID=497109 RepID=UPI002224070F|nr:PNG1 [Candida pseudojiufengensis]KAI5960076.1 PNG1 [Candida pseudojiufengensis]